MSPIPFGGIGEEEERMEGRVWESNKQFERRISTSSHVQTSFFSFFFSSEAVVNLLLSSVTVEMTAGCPSPPLLQHICDYPHSGWRVIWVPLQQALSGLSGPSANYTLRTWEEPISRAPSRIDAGQQGVSCPAGCQTCWGWCPHANAGKTTSTLEESPPVRRLRT